MTQLPSHSSDPYFEWRALTVAKDVEFARENMDAFAVNATRGTAAMTDGAASGLFSGPWARLVAEAVRDDPPDMADDESTRQWLAERRREWRERVDLKSLNFFQREKLRQWGGGSTTLVWCQLSPCETNGQPDAVEADAEAAGADVAALDEVTAWDPDEDHVAAGWEPTQELEPEPEPDAEPLDQTESPRAPFRLRGWAVGDTCLFRVRGREVLWSFPLTGPDEFSQDPQVLGSVPRGDDPLPQFAAFEDRCEPGDLLVMATDAYAWWLIARAIGAIGAAGATGATGATDADSSGEPIDWDALWEMDEQRWREHVVSLRREQGLRHDDTTLLLLRVLPRPTGAEPAATVESSEAGEQSAPEWFAPSPDPLDAGPWETESFTTDAEPEEAN